MFLCPICKEKLKRESNSYKCEAGHCFDVSSSGYVNLLNPGKKNNSRAGDSKEMIRARTLFFESNAYLPISNMLCDIISEMESKVIVDAGCGDGYYTHNIAKSHTESLVLGFDMSKFGCEHGSRVARREGVLNAHYCVGNIFDLPIEDCSCDVIVNLFAPVACEEFHRALRKNGHLIVVSAGINHLDGLKGILYDNVYLNEEKMGELDGFSMCEIRALKYDTVIKGNDNIKNLFTMTPYYHRTSPEDKKKLDSVDEITTCVEVNFTIYKKL